MGNVTEFLAESFSIGSGSADLQPGTAALEMGLWAHYPVFLLPGIVSTSLESWSRKGPKKNNYNNNNNVTAENVTVTQEEEEWVACRESYFRRKVWGDLTMATSFILDKKCWMKILMLDPDTGLDIEGARVRAAQGIDAAEYFIPGVYTLIKYFLLARILGVGEND